MPHPYGVRNDPIKSPLPGFSTGVQKIIENAIEKKDLDFFYRLYLTRMAELSLTGQGKEFIAHASSSLDDSLGSMYMSKGFEAIGALIDLDFLKCNLLLDELEISTKGEEISIWVDQISSLCRAYTYFHNGNYQKALSYAKQSLSSPIQSGTLDPLDKGRLIRLVCVISLIISDVDQIDQCAIDILKIENTDDLKVLDHAKLAIKSMQLLTQGEYKQAYELAKSVIHMEESAGRVGIASPFDCKFVLMRCLYEFSMIDEALQQLAQLKNEAEQNGFKFIKHLCKVGEIRVLSRSPENITLISKEIESLREELLLDPNQESMVWLVDLAEIFIKKTTKDFSRINVIIARNESSRYIQSIGESISPKSALIDAKMVMKKPESTPIEIIRKYLQLSKFTSEGIKKQRSHLKRALTTGEQVAAREIFLRQGNSTLEKIIEVAEANNSQWLESLSRSALLRIKERNTSLAFSGEKLTNREIEVLRYLSSDNSIEHIGKILHISKNTMKTHLRNIYKKLKVKDRKQAANFSKTNLLI